MVNHPALAVGVPEPSSPGQVEWLLRHVPDFAYLPAFEALVPHVGATLDLPAAVAGLGLPWRERVQDALERVATDARQAGAGGQCFLARTMLHFLVTQPIELSEHPLVVALCMRGRAQAGAFEDTPQQVARAMSAC